MLHFQKLISLIYEWLIWLVNLALCRMLIVSNIFYLKYDCLKFCFTWGGFFFFLEYFFFSTPMQPALLSFGPFCFLFCMVILLLNFYFKNAWCLCMKDFLVYNISLSLFFFVIFSPWWIKTKNSQHFDLQKRKKLTMNYKKIWKKVTTVENKCNFSYLVFNCWLYLSN